MCVKGERMKLQISKVSKTNFMFLFSLLLTLLISGCGSSGSAPAPTVPAPSSGVTSQKQEVRVGYVSILSMAPAIIGNEKGLFDQQGIKATFFPFANGADIYKALASGKLDVAYAGVPAAVNWASRGAKIHAIAKVDDGKFGILARADSSISQPSDLKEKKLGTMARGTGADLLVRGFLLPDAKLTEKDVNLVTLDMQNIEGSITSGTIDAGIAGEPFLTLAELRGLKVIHELPDPAIIIIARDAFLQDHADDVHKFIQGHLAAIKYLNSNQIESAKILANTFKVPELNSGGKIFSPTDIIMKALARNHFESKFSDQDFKFYQQISDANLALKLIDKPYQVNNLFDLTWVK